MEAAIFPNSPGLNFSLRTAAELIASGYREEVIQHTSTSTGITYRFARYITDNPANPLYYLVIFQRADFGLERRYATLADIANLLAHPENAGWDLLKFPDAGNAKTRGVLPGLEKLMQTNVFFVGPRWCVISLFGLEASVTKGDKQFTIVLGDNIPKDKDNILRRGHALIPGVGGLNDPSVMDALGYSVYDAAGKEKKEQKLKGADLVTKPGFMTHYTKLQEFKPVPGVNNLLIGRPQCIDIISTFIVPAADAPGGLVQIMPVPTVQPVAPAVPVYIPAPMAPTPNQPGFQDPNRQFQQGPTQPPRGFAVAPQYGGVTTMAPVPSFPTKELPAVIKGRLDTYLIDGRCLKSRNMSRVDTAVKRLLDHQKTKGDLTNTYFNLSTCQFAQVKTKDFIRGSARTASPVYPVLNLAMKRDELQAIMFESGAGNLDDSQWAPHIEEVFRRAADTIIDRLGSTTQFAEQNLSAVPVSILDNIPPGPSPVTRVPIVAQTPFGKQIPLAGIMESTVPSAVGKRCLPGLMVKKRD